MGMDTEGLVDDAAVMAQILQEGYRVCAQVISAEKFLKPLGVQGDTYEEIVIQDGSHGAAPIVEKSSKSSVTRRASFGHAGLRNTGKPEKILPTRPAKREASATQPSWRSTTLRSAHAIPVLMRTAAMEPAPSQLCQL